MQVKGERKVKLINKTSGKRGRPAGSGKVTIAPLVKLTPKQLHELCYVDHETLDLSVLLEYNETLNYWRHRGYYCRDCGSPANNPDIHARKCQGKKPV
jgi:hypothetical protein